MKNPFKDLNDYSLETWIEMFCKTSRRGLIYLLEYNNKKYCIFDQSDIDIYCHDHDKQSKI
jgi:hypothetical protein